MSCGDALVPIERFQIPRFDFSAEYSSLGIIHSILAPSLDRYAPTTGMVHFTARDISA